MKGNAERKSNHTKRDEEREEWRKKEWTERKLEEEWEIEDRRKWSEERSGGRRSIGLGIDNRLLPCCIYFTDMIQTGQLHLPKDTHTLRLMISVETKLSTGSLEATEGDGTNQEGGLLVMTVRVDGNSVNGKSVSSRSMSGL